MYIHVSFPLLTDVRNYSIIYSGDRVAIVWQSRAIRSGNRVPTVATVAGEQVYLKIGFEEQRLAASRYELMVHSL